MFATIVAVAFVAFAIVVLGAIVRFSILSPRITAGADGRLRSPDPEGVEALVGFTPHSEILAFYRQASFLEKKEFYLVDRARTPPAVWSIGSFHPLTSRDVRENIKVVRVNGIPIASDLEKGMYYVTTNGSVRLRSPNIASGDVEVAPNIAELLEFELREHWPGA